jgi:hypothetical protein
MAVCACVCVKERKRDKEKNCDGKQLFKPIDKY